MECCPAAARGRRAAGRETPRWHQVQVGYKLRCARLVDDSTGWAAGTAAACLTGFFHWDGLDWTLHDTIRNQLIYDIAVAADTWWTVGEQFNFPDGLIYRNDGTGWLQQVDPFDRSLEAVSFPAGSLGFAGGASATGHALVVYRDGAWSLESLSFVPQTVLGLDFPTARRGWAVGINGVIYRYDSGTWSETASPTGSALRKVRMRGPGDGWAIGNDGTILRCTGDTWRVARSPTSRVLRDIALTDSGGWIVGDSGTILELNGDTWTRHEFTPDPPHLPLFAVTFNSARHGWAFGQGFMPGEQVALRYYDDGSGIRTERPEPVRPTVTCRPRLFTNRTGVRITVARPTEIPVRDVLGRVVHVLRTGPTGTRWDGCDTDGRPLPPGCYFLGPVARIVKLD